MLKFVSNGQYIYNQNGFRFVSRLNIEIVQFWIYLENKLIFQSDLKKIEKSEYDINNKAPNLKKVVLGMRRIRELKKVSQRNY